MHKRRHSSGFTLVELIVTLVILGVLLGLLVPALTGYIERARIKAVEAEARGIYVAAQAAVSEQYGVNPEFSVRASKFRYNGEKCGRVSNNMLYTVQRAQTPADEPGIGVDTAIARAVLQYLDSSDYATATYRMENRLNPLGQNASSYEKTYGQPGINICYSASGKVAFVEFGRGGILVHCDETGVTHTVDGSFLNAPN